MMDTCKICGKEWSTMAPKVHPECVDKLQAELERETKVGVTIFNRNVELAAEIKRLKFKDSERLVRIKEMLIEIKRLTLMVSEKEQQLCLWREDSTLGQAKTELTQLSDEVGRLKNALGRIKSFRDFTIGDSVSVDDAYAMIEIGEKALERR